MVFNYAPCDSAAGTPMPRYLVISTSPGQQLSRLALRLQKLDGIFAERKETKASALSQ
jgi:hypothetical protein